MNSGVYKITNNVTGKFYIGSTKDINWRWYVHKHDLQKGNHCNPKLQHSWNFHGEDKFTFTILEEVEPDQIKLFDREQYYLDTLRPYERDIGYNIGSKAEGGDNITHNPNRDAFIEKMKIINSGESNGMYGKNHTEETIQKQKNKAIGRYTLDWFIDRYGKRCGKRKFEERRLMLSNREINHFYDNGQLGVPKGKPSLETCNKISETKRRMKEIKYFIIQDIKSNKYTMKMLMEKYNVEMNVIKYYKRKIKKEMI